MADGPGGRVFAALDVTWPHDPSEDEAGIVLAVLDDFGPLAVESLPSALRLFFRTPADRDLALAATRSTFPGLACEPVAVADESWAERSQAALQPIRVGRIIVAPPWTLDSIGPTSSSDVVITIQPSMGFGTGHHASTRLCLGLLQRHLKAGADVIDVGTGSGVLAIAACLTGAAAAFGVDFDPDALASAAENVERNGATAVRLANVDIAADGSELAGRFDLVLANLTGAVLVRNAPTLTGLLKPGGAIITSGFQPHEREEVVAAFAETGAAPVDEAEEEGWMSVLFSASPIGSTGR